ncbi:MAG: hypothetical protein ACRCZF_08050 [Gemmataceae bacterium]
MPARNTPSRVMVSHRVRLMALFSVLVLASLAGADDVVIFKDGFKLQGRRFKEQQILTDPQNGVMVQIPAGRGFDIIEDGPKWTIFSSNAKQLGASLENIRSGPTTKDYTREVFRKFSFPLPDSGEYRMSEFDNNWKRKINVKLPGKTFEVIEQQIAAIGKKRVLIASSTHKWLLAYGTKELPPSQLKAMLKTHPDFVEADGKPDISKRLELCVFLRDAGWLEASKSDLETLRKEHAPLFNKDQSDVADALIADIRRLQNAELLEELELAIQSGRYEAGAKLIGLYDGKLGIANDMKRYTDLRATLESLTPRYENTRRVLRLVVDELSGAQRLYGAWALAGTGAGFFMANGNLDARTGLLISAGEAILRELHPDNAQQLELFTNQALQYEQSRKQNRPATATPMQLLSLAVTGWSLGKNGADNTVEYAARVWQLREAIAQYQIEPIKNRRRELLTRAKLDPKKDLDVLVQLLQYLPVPDPAALVIPPEEVVKRNMIVLPNVVRRNTAAIPESAAGIPYYVRFPAEYHHGRAYPVIVALTNPGLPPEEIIMQLAAEADRHGYIILAPVWNRDGSSTAYDYKGDRHYIINATLRDALRHYRIENDKVFLVGFAEGANFALDMGLSHPDLFAGVIAMAPNPKFFGHFIHYWKNAQKLPIYCVVGNLAGPAYENLRKLFENWMPRGYSALLTVYKGRAVEWFGLETPNLFEWMRRKQRAVGTQSLRLNTTGFEPWQTMRRTDNRFYWVGTTNIAKGNLLETNDGKNLVPAEIIADIRQGNQIEIKSRGLKDVVVWLNRDMIDWTKPVSFRVNGQTPYGYKPKVFEPDLDLMLETFHETGDRRMQFLGRMDFPTIP